jgi:hypothetical protein
MQIDPPRNNPRFRFGAMVLCCALGGAPVAAQAPLSAIDWLSDSVSAPEVALPPERPENRTTTSAAIESITVHPLDAPSPDGLGVLSRAQTGFPDDLWRGASVDVLSHQISTFPIAPLPAVQELFIALMQARLDPPQTTASDGAFFLTRVDALLARGALEPARRLLQRVATPTPPQFRRAFDIALLTGTEDTACQKLRATPGISPSFPLRVFCLARTGDWPAAALTLHVAQALGTVTADESALLARFLDPELFEGAPPLPRPEPLTPLAFKMHAAIGEPISQASLPLAFAHADLRRSAGWKARIAAAERLVRVGVIPVGTLLDVYTERTPAASGGAWDRVAAVQLFDAAFRRADWQAASEQLPVVWQEMERAGLGIAFSQLYGAGIAPLALREDRPSLALYLRVLSSDYDSRDLAAPDSHPEEQFLIALAKGFPERAIRSGITARAALEQAIIDGFAPAPDTLSTTVENKIAAGRHGEVLLDTLASLPGDKYGDLTDITRSLIILRRLGFESTARKIGIQYFSHEPYE